jgi:hypothetical protein
VKTSFIKINENACNTQEFGYMWKSWGHLHFA